MSLKSFSLEQGLFFMTVTYWRDKVSCSIEFQLIQLHHRWYVYFTFQRETQNTWLSSHSLLMLSGFSVKMQYTHWIRKMTIWLLHCKVTFPPFFPVYFVILYKSILCYFDPIRSTPPPTIHLMVLQMNFWFHDNFLNLSSHLYWLTWILMLNIAFVYQLELFSYCNKMLDFFAFNYHIWLSY